MSAPRVRLHMFSAGMLSCHLGLFLAGEEGEITFPVPVYLIEHPEGLVTVDAGLHPDLSASSERLGVMNRYFTTHLPADGSGTVGPVLDAAGFDPTQVGLAILTHLHFDHVGGLVQLPEARLVVQSREWALRHDEELVERGSYLPADYDLGHDVLELDGDHDLFGDGTVTCLLTDGHTPGHQSVRVVADDATYVICGDCCYLRRTLRDEHLPAVSADPERQLTSLRRLAAEQAAGATPLFGHDPEQWAAVQREGLHAGV